MIVNMMSCPNAARQSIIHIFNCLYGHTHFDLVPIESKIVDKLIACFPVIDVADLTQLQCTNVASCNVGYVKSTHLRTIIDPARDGERLLETHQSG